MSLQIDRREFLKLAGIGSAVLVTGLNTWGSETLAKQGDFFFVQISDSHWGFNNANANPDFSGTLAKAVTGINSLKQQPDFIIFTGDLTHDTDDDQDRRKRMSEFREIIKSLKVKNIKFIPGEHDAAVDGGTAFKEFFGPTHHSFDHKGVHFIALDNVSDPRALLGDAQLKWMADDLKKHNKNAPIVVFAHRPLFDLKPDWEWNTRDGAKAVDLLMPYKNVVVFYGHIHQENDHMTGHIAHHAARGSMYPLPPPTAAVKAPVPWDPAVPYKGLGFRGIKSEIKPVKFDLTEFSIAGEVSK